VASAGLAVYLALTEFVPRILKEKGIVIEKKGE